MSVIPENEEIDDIPTFAKRIKAKFPDYAELDDVELVERVVRKHPVYASRVKLPSEFKLSNATSGYAELDSLYEKAGREHNVPIDLLIEQGRQETSFDPDVMYGRRTSRNAQGKVIGAAGSGQFMPGTAARFNVDVKDPRSGIDGQARYMRKLLDQFDGDEELALAGYNAGEGAVEKRGRKIPPFKETQGYVKNIREKLAAARATLTLKNLWRPEATTIAPPPVPEKPETLAAQMQAALDPNIKARAAVLTTAPDQNAVFGNAQGFTPFPLPEGRTLWVNTEKAKKVLKLKDAAHIQTYLEKNPAAIQRLTGTATDAGNNTSTGPTVLTTGPDGTELSAKIAPTPDDQAKQFALDQESFPGAQSQVVDAQNVVALRSQPVPGHAEEIIHPDAQPYNIPATEHPGGLVDGETRSQLQSEPANRGSQPGARAPGSDADFRTANKYLKSQGQPEITREQFDALQKPGSVEVSATVNAPVSDGPTAEALPTQFKAANKPLTDAELGATSVKFRVPLEGVKGDKRLHVISATQNALMKKFGLTSDQAANAISDLDAGGDFNAKEITVEVPRQWIIDAGGAAGVKADYDAERARPTLDLYQQTDALNRDRSANRPELGDVPTDINLDQAERNIASTLFSSGDQAAVEAERERPRKYSLTDEEQAEADQVGKNLADRLGIGAAAGSGIMRAAGSTLESVAGILRVGRMVDWKAHLMPEDWIIALSKEGQKYGAASGSEALANPGVLQDALRLTTGLAGDVPRLVMLSRIPGGAPVLFATDAGLQSIGRGERASSTVGHIAKGAALGAIFKGAGKVAAAVENNTLRTFINPVFDIGKTATPKERLVAKLFGEGAKLGTIGAGTFTAERVSGASNEEAFNSAVTMALTSLVMDHGPDIAAGIKGLAGKVFRVTKGEKTADVTVTPEGDVKLLKGAVPEPLVDVDMVLDPVTGVYKSKAELPQKRLGEAPPLRVTEAMPEAVAKIPKDTRAQKISTILQDGEPKTVDQLKKATRYSHENILNAIDTLYQARQVEILPDNSIRSIGEPVVKGDVGLFEKYSQPRVSPETKSETQKDLSIVGEMRKPGRARSADEMSSDYIDRLQKLIKDDKIDAAYAQSLLTLFETNKTDELDRILAQLEQPSPERKTEVSNEPPETGVSKEQVAATYDALPQQKPQEVEKVAPKATVITKERPDTAKTLNVFTERGTKATIEPRVIDAGDILTSFDEGYPTEFQPRDRSRVASKAQISEIAAGLNPEKLGDSANAGDGRPLVVPVMIDGKEKYAVISGNGRTEAIREAYESGNEGSKAYAEFVESKGKGGDTPVYVGVLDPNEVDLAKFAHEANESAQARMSPTEQAMADADRMDSGMLQAFVPADDGSIHREANRDFIRTFSEMNMSKAERGAYILPDGSLNQDGVNRVRNAIFAKAFGDSKAGRAAIERMAESTSDSVKNITNALLARAPHLAAFKDAAKIGSRYKQFEISDDIAAAVARYARLKAPDAKVKTLDEYIQQGNMFGADTTPFQTRIMQVLDTYKKSPKAIKSILGNYIAAAEALGDPNQVGMFGQKDIPSVESIFEGAVTAYENSISVEPTQKSLLDKDQGREPEPGTRPESSEALAQVGGEGQPQRIAARTVDEVKAEPHPALEKTILTMPPAYYEGSPSKPIPPFMRSVVRRELGKGFSAEEVADVYDLSPREVAALKEISDENVGKFGQTSHFIRRGLTADENAPLINRMAKVLVPEARIHENNPLFDKMTSIHAILDTIANQAGKPRSSHMDAGDWNSFLLNYADSLPLDVVTIINDALDHQAEWHAKRSAFIKDAELATVLEKIARIADIDGPASVSDYKKLPLAIRKEILRIGRKYGTKENQGFTGLSDTVIKAAFNESLRRTVTGELEARTDNKTTGKEKSADTGEGTQEEIAFSRSDWKPENYFRVMPRDLFNEAKALSMHLKLIDDYNAGKLPEGFEIEISGTKPRVALSEDGELFLPNFRAYFNGDPIDFTVSYNAGKNDKFPMIAMTSDQGVVTVYDSDGNLDREFKDEFGDQFEQPDEMVEKPDTWQKATEFYKQLGVVGLWEADRMLPEDFVFDLSDPEAGFQLDLDSNEISSRNLEANYKGEEVRFVMRPGGELRFESGDVEGPVLSGREMSDEFTRFLGHDISFTRPGDLYAQTDLFGNPVTVQTSQPSMFADMEAQADAQHKDELEQAYGQRTATYISSLEKSPNKQVAQIARELGDARKLVMAKGDGARDIVEDASDALDTFAIAQHQKAPIELILKQGRMDQVELSGRAQSFARAMASGGFATAFRKVLSDVATDVQYMTAWHGSPHTFDKFKLDDTTIGTGEGAQAYGHGLYFTDKESIAEHYRKGRANKAIVTVDNGEPESLFNLLNDERFTEPERATLSYLFQTWENVAGNATYGLERAVERFKKWDLPDRREAAERLLTRIQSAKTGAKYKVDLKPAPDEYLLWDKPLSEQSEKVQTLLRPEFEKVGSAHPFSNPLPASEARNTKLNYFYKQLGRNLGSDKAASEYLKSLGIRGIKFLDGSSRGKGEGSYNYVIFDDADVEIQEVMKATARELDRAESHASVYMHRFTSIAPKKLARNATGKTEGLFTVSPEGLFLIRHAIENQQGTDPGAFWGAYLTPRNAQMVRRGLEKIAPGSEFVSAYDKAIDAQHGDLAFVVDLPKFPIVTKLAGQEEMSHRADYRVRNNVNQTLEPYKKLDSYNAAVQNVRKSYPGVSEVTLHNEVIAKLFRDDATDELGIDVAAQQEIENEYVYQLLDADKTPNEIAAAFESVSPKGKEFAENVRSTRTREKDESGTGDEISPVGRGGQEVRETGGPGRAKTFEPDADRLRKLRETDLSGRSRKGDEIDGAESQSAAPPLSDRLARLVTPKENILVDRRTKGNAALANVIKGEIAYARLDKDLVLGALRSAKGVAIDLLNAPRAIKASSDLSAAGRQGLILGPANPVLFIKAFGKQLQMLPPKYGARKYAEFKRDLDLHPYIELAEASELHLTSLGHGEMSHREEAFLSSILGDDPYFVGTKKETVRKAITFPVRASERAYVTMLDKLRLDVFAKLAKQVHEYNARKGRPDDSKQYEAIAKFINYASGRGDLGKLNDAAPILNAMFFSPRYWMSRLQVMNPGFYAKLPPGTRVPILKNMFAFIGAVALVVALLKAAGFDIELGDEDNPDLVKLKLGNYTYDFTAGLIGHLRYAARMIMAVPEAENNKAAAAKMEYLTGRYLRSKLAPIPAGGYNAFVGENYIGEPTSVKEEAIGLFTPIMIDNFSEAIKAEKAQGALKMVPEFFGISTTRFKSTAEISDKIREERAKLESAGPMARKEIHRRIELWQKQRARSVKYAKK